MAGIFDIKRGTFDSSEAALLLRSYEIALHGLRATHAVDGLAAQRLARAIIKVARNEPDCIGHDGAINPAQLAQRAILRMLQMNAERRNGTADEAAKRAPLRRAAQPSASPERKGAAPPDPPGKIMLRLFDRTSFAKL